MTGKRALWRERCDDRVRERRRRQGRVMAALIQADADAGAGAAAVAPAEPAASSKFDLCAWLRLGPAGEGPQVGVPPILDP